MVSDNNRADFFKNKWISKIKTKFGMIYKMAIQSYCIKVIKVC